MSLSEPLTDDEIANMMRADAPLVCQRAAAEISRHRQAANSVVAPRAIPAGQAAKSHEERARAWLIKAFGSGPGDWMSWASEQQVAPLAAEFATVASAQQKADAKIAEADRALNERQTLSAQRIAAAIRKGGTGEQP